MGFWSEIFNIRTEEEISEQETSKEEQAFDETDDVLRDIFLSNTVDQITESEALEIPAVQATIEKICNIVSTLDIQLYKDVVKDGKLTAELIEHDKRVELINQDTGDTLDGVMFKKAMVSDYYLSGRAHAYIHKAGNDIKSLHYVEADLVAFTENTDPIFKDYDILVNGKRYLPFDFLTITRKTKDGYNGKGIIEECNNVLNVGYSLLKEEKREIQNGGQKKGFVKSVKKLTKAALTELKNAWKKLYKSDDSVIVLNDGLDFKEISNTAVEMEMKEKKESNTKDIWSLFGITDLNDDNDVIKNAVIPFLNAFEKACDRFLLLESEKEDGLYYKFDTKNLLKGTIKERYEAYKTGVQAGIISRNEARYFEDMEQIPGLDLITFSLGEVIYDIKTGKFFTPNTGGETDLKGNIKQPNGKVIEKGKEGGEDDED